MTPFEEFYQAYPNKQAKSRCEGYYKKIDKDEHTRIMLALDAHKRWRREAQKAGEFVANWPNAATWIYQKRYNDELPCSTSELKEKQKTLICGMDGCNNEAIATGRCLECEAKVPDWKTKILRKRWEELGSPKGKADCLRVMYACNPTLARMINRG